MAMLATIQSRRLWPAFSFTVGHQKRCLHDEVGLVWRDKNPSVDKVQVFASALYLAVNVLLPVVGPVTRYVALPDMDRLRYH